MEPGRSPLHRLVLEYSCRHRLEQLVRVCLRGWDTSFPEDGTLPLRIACAALWSMVTRHCADHYGRVVDFVNIVWQQASDLLSYRHYLKLSIAFKAKVVMEMFVKRRSSLDILQTLDTYFPKLHPADPRATRRDVQKERRCRLQFRKLVLLLIRDGNYREQFLRDEMEKEYGSLFMTAARKLLWEFLERLESALPHPRVDQLLASCVDGGSLSLQEQSLVSLLAESSRPVPSDVPRGLQQQWSGDRSDGGRSGAETGPTAPGSSGAGQSEPRGGPCPGAEPVTPDTWEGHGRTSAREELLEEEAAEAAQSGTGPRVGGTGPRQPRARGRAVRECGREGRGGRAGRPQPMVFSALRFDQLSDEESGGCPWLTLSPPNPLQSQRGSSPPPACTPHQSCGAGGPCPLVSRLGAGKSRGTEGTDCPQSPNQGPRDGVDIELLATAAPSPEVLRSSHFQPKVLLFRLSREQEGQPEAAKSRGLQREDPVGSGEHCQLSQGAHTPAWRWNLRTRPREWRLRRASCAVNEQDRSPLSSSEESSHSDTSDYEYFPFCSQLTASGRWTTYPRRNEMGQFIGAKNKGIDLTDS